MQVFLTNNKSIIIDDEDYELVKNYHWFTYKDYKTEYAIAHTKTPSGRETTVRMHRIIMKATSKQEIDHINGNGLDNRKENLRRCSHAQNMRNQHSICGSSQYKGVSWNKRAEKWRAKIQVDKKQVYLGSFSSEVEAASAYDQAALKYFGEFAKLNKGGSFGSPFIF